MMPPGDWLRTGVWQLSRGNSSKCEATRKTRRRNGLLLTVAANLAVSLKPQGSRNSSMGAWDAASTVCTRTEFAKLQEDVEKEADIQASFPTRRGRCHCMPATTRSALTRRTLVARCKTTTRHDVRCWRNEREGRPSQKPQRPNDKLDRKREGGFYNAFDDLPRRPGNLLDASESKAILLL